MSTTALQVLQTQQQMNQWVAQQQMAASYYYHCDPQQAQAHKAIRHWSNISPRDSESEESDGSSCHSSVSNPSPRSDSGIFDTSAADETFHERSLSPPLSVRSSCSEGSDRKTSTCLGILNEIKDLRLSDADPGKVNIPATTMAFVQQTNGLSLSSAPPTPRDMAGATWVSSRPTTTACPTPNDSLISPTTEYAPVAASTAASGSTNVGVFPPSHLEKKRSSSTNNSNRRHRHRSRHRHSRQTHHSKVQPSVDCHSMARLEQLQQIQYQQQLYQQQQYAQQMQYLAYQQQAAAAQMVNNGSYQYPHQSYVYPNTQLAVPANVYNCM